MDEERLAAIEAKHERLNTWKTMPEHEWQALLVDTLNASLELIAEVRRLRKKQNDQGYDYGVESAYADIADIILDPMPSDASDTAILAQIKAFIGLDEE